ncbi:MAG: NAD(P)/FAD-dependent oxidoreductase [Spirochaetaceae bacterium]|nr:MAG: NAD(P)/FAD-dependent oxidoreductase [Spirochaetaceae bacterium]
MKQYDVVIIGIGTAGQTAAQALSDAGKSVAMVDYGPVGGTCALRGCQPKKYFVVNTQLVAETRALSGYGVAGQVHTDWPALQAFKRDFTDPIPDGVVKSLREDGIDVFVERAAFTEPGKLILEPSGTVLQASHFIIATGAQSRPLSIPGGELAATSDDFLELESLPESIIFIGGGYISLEFAFIAAIAGSRVTVLQRGPRMLPLFPASLVDPVVEAGQKLGIQFVTDADVSEIVATGSGFSVRTEEKDSYDAAWVMSAIGRVPNIEKLGLEKIGLDTESRGIVVDDYLQTSADGVYAIGDCAATKQLAPISDMEAQIAAANIITPQSQKAVRDAIPSVVFTNPQIASVGITREEAEAGNLDVVVKSGDGGRWPSSRRLRGAVVRYETIADAATGQLLGAHIVSPHAGEQINVFTLAIRNKVTTEEFATIPWAYPTYTSDAKYMV